MHIFTQHTSTANTHKLRDLPQATNARTISAKSARPDNNSTTITERDTDTRIEEGHTVHTVAKPKRVMSYPSLIKKSILTFCCTTRLTHTQVTQARTDLQPAGHQ